VRWEEAIAEWIAEPAIAQPSMPGLHSLDRQREFPLSALGSQKQL
jgi:hypothetical protein